MKTRFWMVLVLMMSAVAPVQAGFWDRVKKGLGIEQEAPQAEAVPRAETPMAEMPMQAPSIAVPPPVAEPAPPDDTIVWSAATANFFSPDGTAIDSATGLMWMRCAEGQTWTGATCSGEAAEFKWEAARGLRRTYAGHSDWRLPSIRELQTLVELGREKPAIDTAIFPATPSSDFWSGSPNASKSSYAWGVYFSDGYASNGDRSYDSHVRLVRGGQSLALLSEPSNAETNAIQALIRNRKWGVREPGDYAQRAEARLRAAQAAHQALPEPLQALNTRLQAPPTAPPKLDKDEFETRAAFQARVAKAQAAYEAQVAEYNQQVADYERRVKDHYARLGPLPDAPRHQALRTAFLESHAAPTLSELRYDADAQSFYAVISEKDGGDLKKPIAVRDIPPARARALKADLERATPEVHFRIHADNSLTWDRVDLRTGRENLVAVPVNALGEKQTLEVAIKALDVATPNVAMPKAVALQAFDIRDDPALAAQQAEVERLKREQAQAAFRAAELKRLKEEEARLRQTRPVRFQDDLQARLASVPAAKPDKHLHVLAIGIDEYSDVPDVPFADRSAKLFAELAAKTLGALPENILTLTNQEATSGRLRGRLRILLGRLTPEDRLLLYFAGHGVPAQNGKEVFLLAQDGGPGSYEEPDLQLNALYAQVSQSRVGQAYLFIDACFSGRSNKDSMILGGTAGVAIVPKHGLRADSRLTVITAGRAEQLSNQYEARGHRLFGYHLMKALLNDGPTLSAGELFGKIRGTVRAESLRLGPEFEQEPELLGNAGAVVKR